MNCKASGGAPTHPHAIRPLVGTSYGRENHRVSEAFIVSSIRESGIVK